MYLISATTTDDQPLSLEAEGGAGQRYRIPTIFCIKGNVMKFRAEVFEHPAERCRCTDVILSDAT
jgi:hypothetical protein